MKNYAKNSDLDIKFKIIKLIYLAKGPITYITDLTTRFQPNFSNNNNNDKWFSNYFQNRNNDRFINPKASKIKRASCGRT